MMMALPFISIRALIAALLHALLESPKLPTILVGTRGISAGP
jgi:hypothetical protein